MMEYVEYFNLLDSGYKSFSFSLTGVIFVIIGIAGLILFILLRKRSTRLSKHPVLFLIFICCWLGFAVLWTGTSVASTYSEYIDLKNALVNNAYYTVEGVVDNFHPMPYAGHEHETFTVQGIQFEYSDYLVTNAFNNTKSHGGPIDQGKFVKIYYYEGKIIRLWVKE